MSSLKLTVDVERLEFSAPFRIAGFVFEHQDAILVTLEGDGLRGRAKLAASTSQRYRRAHG